MKTIGRDQGQTSRLERGRRRVHRDYLNGGRRHNSHRTLTPYRVVSNTKGTGVIKEVSIRVPRKSRWPCVPSKKKSIDFVSVWEKETRSLDSPTSQTSMTVVVRYFKLHLYLCHFPTLFHLIMTWTYWRKLGTVVVMGTRKVNIFALVKGSTDSVKSNRKDNERWFLGSTDSFILSIFFFYSHLPVCRSWVRSSGPVLESRWSRTGEL